MVGRRNYIAGMLFSNDNSLYSLIVPIVLHPNNNLCLLPKNLKVKKRNFCFQFYELWAFYGLSKICFLFYSGESRGMQKNIKSKFDEGGFPSFRRKEQREKESKFLSPFKTFRKTDWWPWYHKKFFKGLMSLCLGKYFYHRLLIKQINGSFHLQINSDEIPFSK